MSHEIVVGVEGTQSSRRAVHWAAEAAWARRAELVLVHAVGKPVPGHEDTWADIVSTTVHRMLRDEADRARRTEPGLSVRTEVVRRHRHGRGPARPRAQGPARDGVHGARYLHVLVPCPLGWASPPAQTVQIARLAAESGYFPAYEAEYGEATTVRRIRRQVPVADYLEPQDRYAHPSARSGTATFGGRLGLRRSTADTLACPNPGTRCLPQSSSARGVRRSPRAL